MIPAWIAFIIVIALIMIFSKKELGIILSIATLIFAILTQVNLLDSILTVFTNPSNIILILIVALIPILGGIMDDSGLMMELVQKMDVSKKVSLIVGPAFFGLLPVPGGALMSAPIVDQIDKDLHPNKKIAINVWYRHALLLIYPISPVLIIGSLLAGISIYLIVVAMIIPFIIMSCVGYFTLFRSVDKERESFERDLKRVIRNFSPILIAPVIDFLGRTFFNLNYPEIFLLIGLFISIWISIIIAKMPLSKVNEVAKKMKIWRFPLVMFAILWFLEIFIKSGLPEDIGALKLPFIIFICLGFILGFTTGRVQIPFSILIPIYLIQNGITSMILMDFVFLYCATFLGYLITPIHPCLAYSINYFKTDYKGALKHLIPPVSICFGLLLSLYLLYILL